MTDETYSWLPGRHLGVAASLAHADELIGEVCTALFPYQTSGIVNTREERDGGVSRLVVDEVIPVPRRVPLLVSDVLVTLRAAIEHLLFAEIEFLEGPLGAGAARLVEMPACEAHDAFDGWLKKQSRKRPTNLREGTELVRRIRALQPFQRVQNPSNHPLARLTRHTNWSKHRTPALTVASIPLVVEANETPSLADAQRPNVPANIGDVLVERPTGDTSPYEVYGSIGINVPGTDSWPVLVEELDDISRWVRTQAVPMLITGETGRQTDLPPRYDIGAAVEDERAALADGTESSAAEHYNRRLMGIYARMSLLTVFQDVDHAPADGAVEKWISNLSDDEAIRTVHRMKPSGPAARR